MEIINIVVCSLNSVDSIKSFVVTPTSNRDEVVKQAEEEFERMIREIGYDEDDDLPIDAVLDNGYFTYLNQTVCISWSDKVEVKNDSATLNESFDLLRAVLTESSMENEFDKDIYTFLKDNQQVTPDYVPYWEE